MIPTAATASRVRSNADSSSVGKPTITDEFNPDPPMAPQAMQAQRCRAESLGSYYAAWRHGQSPEAWAETLRLFAGPCEPAQCPAPQPDRSALFWKVEASWGGYCDPTPNVRGACEYCASIGMGQMGDGSIRCSCPMRNEGDPNRVPCEQWALQAPGPQWTSDGTVELDSGGWRARCDHCSWLKVCDGSGTVCMTVRPGTCQEVQ